MVMVENAVAPRRTAPVASFLQFAFLCCAFFILGSSHVWAQYGRTTTTITVKGKTLPPGSYLWIVYDGGDVWLTSPYTDAERIPKSAVTIVETTAFSPPLSGTVNQHTPVNMIVPNLERNPTSLNQPQYDLNHNQMFFEKGDQITILTRQGGDYAVNLSKRLEKTGFKSGRIPVSAVDVTPGQSVNESNLSVEAIPPGGLTLASVLLPPSTLTPTDKLMRFGIMAAVAALLTGIIGFLSTRRSLSGLGKISIYVAVIGWSYLLSLLIYAGAPEAIFASYNLEKTNHAPLTLLSMVVFVMAVVVRHIISALKNTQKTIDPKVWSFNKSSGEYQRITYNRGDEWLVQDTTYSQRATKWLLGVRNNERGSITFMAGGMVFILVAKYLDFQGNSFFLLNNGQKLFITHYDELAYLGLMIMWAGAWLGAFAERGRWRDVGPQPIPLGGLSELEEQQAYGNAGAAGIGDIHAALSGNAPATSRASAAPSGPIYDE